MVAQLRDRLDNGRKVAIQHSDFHDRHGVTIRQGNLHRINQKRFDLFDRSSDESTMRRRIAKIEVDGRAAFPVGRPDFKSGKDRETVLGGFDSHSLPPNLPSPKWAER